VKVEILEAVEGESTDQNKPKTEKFLIDQ